MKLPPSCNAMVMMDALALLADGQDQPGMMWEKQHLAATILLR
jgi:hypothetical protein